MGQNKDTITKENKGKDYKIIISEVKGCFQQTNEGKRRLIKFLMELVKDKSI